MALIPLVIDSQVSYVAGQRDSLSLLTLPLGPTTVLDHLVSQIAGEELEIGYILVMPVFPVTPTYQATLHASTIAPVQIVSPESLHLKLGEYEATDHLLVIEPRLWPVNGHDPAMIRSRLREYRGATYAICVGSDVGGTHEWVQCDPDGYVKRIQRFYNQMHWPPLAKAAIAYALVPARFPGEICFRSLNDLRAGLSAQGVLSYDHPLVSDVIDLGRGDGFLSLHEKTLSDWGDVVQPPPGFSAPRPRILVGPQARIHPETRLVPPVIVQGGATIEEGSMVIGPALIGAGSIVRRGAVIVQSVLAPGTVVSEDTTVRHRVMACQCNKSIEGDEIPRDTVAENAEEMAGRVIADGDMAASGLTVTRWRNVHVMIKRLMDIVLSAASLIILSPLLLLVALLIKLDSPGPVFFSHRRERKGGKEFSCLKFRTMVADAHRRQRELYVNNEVDGPQFKIAYDPRVTRLGRLLRATNIDELPQLINVFVGHMSLVGPRPSPFRENQICVPWRLARLSVRPGITGLWQICRADDRTRGDFHEWIYYDITYVRQFSIWLDLKILLATVISLGGRWSVPLSWIIRTRPRSRLRPQGKVVYSVGS